MFKTFPTSKRYSISKFGGCLIKKPKNKARPSRRSYDEICIRLGKGFKKHCQGCNTANPGLDFGNEYFLFVRIYIFFLFFICMQKSAMHMLIVYISDDGVERIFIRVFVCVGNFKIVHTLVRSSLFLLRSRFPGRIQALISA